MGKGPQYISQYEKVSTINKFNKEKGPQYISSILKRVHNILVQYGKVSTINKSIRKVSTYKLDRSTEETTAFRNPEGPEL